MDINETILTPATPGAPSYLSEDVEKALARPADEWQDTDPKSFRRAIGIGYTRESVERMFARIRQWNLRDVFIHALNTASEDIPWWEGGSIYAPTWEGLPGPSGDLWHVFIHPSLPVDLAPGLRLTSPAERRNLPWQGRAPHLTQAKFNNGYDPHALYVTTTAPRTRYLPFARVHVDGPMWPDPERGLGTNWCCASATILELHMPDRLSVLTGEKALAYNTRNPWKD